jgi:hypothetical protein
MLKIALITAGILCLWISPYAAIGPFEISSPDSSTTLKIQLAAQLWTAWENKDNGTGREHESTLYMKVRRIRPTLSVSLSEYKTSFKLHLSTAPGSIELMDFYSDTKLSSLINFRFGQYKIPYTRYRIQSFQRLTFVDWAIVTRYFGAERQMGLSVHNGYEKPPRWGYAFGLFSGVNARASHAVGLASIYGEKPVNPSDLSGTARKTEFHPELVGHVSYNANDINVSTDSDAGGGEFRYSIAASAAWDMDPTDFEDMVLRLAPELLCKYRHLSVMSTGFIGFVDMDGSIRTRKAITGFLVQAAYCINRRVELSLRYAAIDIDDKITDEALLRAQAIVADADDDDITTQYKNAGNILGEREGTFGINVYLDGHGLKVQNDIAFTRYQRRDEDRTDWLARSQLQLSF